jgi:hypothetical protein
MSDYKVHTSDRTCFILVLTKSSYIDIDKDRATSMRTRAFVENNKPTIPSTRFHIPKLTQLVLVLITNPQKVFWASLNQNIL